MMVDENTPQPKTIDCCPVTRLDYIDFKFLEKYKINCDTVQSDHSTQVQIDFANWAKKIDIWHTSMSYETMVKEWYAATSDITWNGSYKRGLVTYQNESGDDIDEIYETEYDGMEIIT